MRVDFQENENTKRKLLVLPDEVMYKVARMTLDMSIKRVPMSRGKVTSGQLRRSTLVYGVRGNDGDYSIGSQTSYAKYVYKMPEGTHWTTPGTHGKWFHRTFKEHGATIIKKALDQSFKE